MSSLQAFSEQMCSLQRGREESGFPTIFDHRALSGRGPGRSGIPRESGAWGGWGRGGTVGVHTLSNALATSAGLITGPDPFHVSHLSWPLGAPAPSTVLVDTALGQVVKARICHAKASGPGGLSQHLPTLLWGMAPQTAKRGQDAAGDSTRASGLWRGDPTDSMGKFPDEFHASRLHSLAVLTCPLSPTPPPVACVTAWSCSPDHCSRKRQLDFLSSVRVAWIFFLVCGWPARIEGPTSHYPH